MRHLHESLQRDHHLRHFGWLQYGLFLKSIGLTLEQTLTFWRTEFTKKMEPDKVCDYLLENNLYCHCIRDCFFIVIFQMSICTAQLKSDIVLLHILTLVYCPDVITERSRYLEL